ncbi:MAG: dockerin type I repeat-containing protein [Candidatus Saccharibacteria bacterium]|nr:dockerin type I repeat-containing protein [Candidatus Saccharibacteria bacterium]
MRIKKGRLKWGSIIIAFVAAFGAMFGLLSGKIVKAFDGDDWTTTYDGLSMTVVSVQQNGSSLSPIDDGEGGYYFRVANNTDAVRVGIRVEGMVQDETYYYYPTSQWWMDSRIDLTYEDNGIVIYEELEPEITFDDNYYLSGIYHLGASVSREHGSGVQKNIVVRPTSIGSHSIDIISVKQGDTVLALTNNEYQITDYTTPVTVTYKFKNLEAGKTYSAGLGYNDWYQFKAENAQTAATARELTLDLINRHISTNIYLQNSDVDERVDLYFAVADSGFNQLGDIVIDEIEQGGVALVPEADTSGWQRQYTFNANDAQSLTVRMHTTRATADMNYYILFNMYGYGYGSGYSSEEPLMVTGEELEQAGVVLTVPAPYGLSESSPLTLSFVVSTTGVDTHGYDGERNVVYKQYANPQNSSDTFKFNVEENENVPRYDAMLYYSDGTRIDDNRISPALHDAEHPLLLEVKGERYNSATTYNIEAKVRVNGRTEPYSTYTFAATGAELNEGAVFTLNGPALELPEFDPSGATSGYELSYNFSLSIDGLMQSGEMFYVYEGWINPSITYNNGDVVAMGSGGGIGGDAYTTMNGATIRKSSLSGSRGAVINYFMSGFDDILNYDYTLYYNDNAGEEWWSAPAGRVIFSGTAKGEALNTDGLATNIAMPSNESEGVMYTLVITRGGKIVRIARDSIVFTSEPQIESFKFTADSDSFMQTDRTSYRVAIGTNAMATLTGSGFDNDAEYKIWVSYEGHKFVEGFESPQYVDLSALNNSVVVTGAQLNAGYAYALNYVEAFDGVNFVDVGFAVSDKDADEPNWYGETGNGSYSGHGIHIDYVNDDEVFRDNGYQVNDDGTITDVSQPTGIEVRNLTDGNAETMVIESSLNVTSGKACVVIGQKNGAYEIINAVSGAMTETTKTYTYDLTGYTDVMVILKGDVDMRGSLSARDSAKINYHLLSGTNPNHRDLTALEMLVADVDGNGRVTARDAAIINYALLSGSNPNHRDLSW